MSKDPYIEAQEKYAEDLRAELRDAVGEDKASEIIKDEGLS